MPTDLRCPVCGNSYADHWRCECDHPLDFATQPLPDGPAPAFADLDTRDGLWAFADFLPIERAADLGAGWTPIVDSEGRLPAESRPSAGDAPEWNATFKLEYVSPTGSFKDRGAATTIARAIECGADRVIEDSSGNAGTAIATYAARAGLDSEIYVPADAKAAKLRAIERTGADVVRVEGTRAAVTTAAIENVENDAGWYASHAWNPAFFAGTATFALELAAQCDWQVPDAIVSPLGHGTLFLGAYRGFRALHEAGWTDEMPRLLGAQAAGYAPIVDRLDGHTDPDDPNDLADGIQIRDPVRIEAICESIQATDGDAIAIDAETTREEHERLGRAGFDVEPTCAVAPAALHEYRERGVVDDTDHVVVPLTGAGSNA
ncbi:MULTISPECIES: pyridoxal-phosphate dependent enzyme [Halococcus]|uniref:Pyridoxal-5'-phosphate-dependent protein subunit beta n=1 Tax=Halococcus salifodinae DSM 8989 TaxID=1227456 RepID=M0NET4_9EURY|nr:MULTISPECIES: pyridoxal-phosphate dependent enzyme [Halococcus]EMA55205.1 pyridoxal-5'-phosphate-dependent protein subunit beta [Halococcus salifodinae DSM 8989]